MRRRSSAGSSFPTASSRSRPAISDLRGGEDVRPRGLAARPERVQGDLLLLELRGLPGPARRDPIPPRGGREAGVRAHLERLRPRDRPHPRRHPRELPARRRLGRDPRSAATLHGRPDGDPAPGLRRAGPTGGAAAVRPRCDPGGGAEAAGLPEALGPRLELRPRGNPRIPAARGMPGAGNPLPGRRLQADRADGARGNNGPLHRSGRGSSVSSALRRRQLRSRDPLRSSRAPARPPARHRRGRAGPRAKRAPDPLDTQHRAAPFPLALLLERHRTS